jgi:hypothetical protein
LRGIGRLYLSYLSSAPARSSNIVGTNALLDVVSPRVSVQHSTSYVDVGLTHIHQWNRAHECVSMNDNVVKSLEWRQTGVNCR